VNSPLPQKTDSARIWKILVCLLLLLSATLTAVISSAAQPENPPDESHHFSLIRYLAKHPLEFPVRYERVKGEHKEYNTIIHPPLYYYAMSGVLLALDPRGSSGWQGSGRMKRDARDELIMHLRRFSLFFTLAGLWGMFRLFFWLMNQQWLTPPMAAAAALLSVFIPSTLYGNGSLNNDVFVWALWPFLALYSGRFYCFRDKEDLFKFLFFAALMTLSKATAWFLVAGLSIPVASVLLARPFVGKIFQNDTKTVVKSRLPGLIWAVAAAFIFIVTFLHVGRLIMVYGSPQPAYWKVYGGSIRDSQFYRIPAEGLPERSFKRLSYEAGVSLIQTASGIMAHRQTSFDSKPGNLLLMLFSGTSALLALGLIPLFKYRWKDTCRSLFLAAVFTAVPVLFLLIFLGYCWYAYHLQGMYGNHARYFTGYLQLFWIGVMMITSTPACISFWPPLVRRLLAAGAVSMLGFIFCRPYYFFQYMEDGQRFMNHFMGVGL